MKIAVDFSIFTKESGSFGNISGEVDLAFIPQIGDSLSFSNKNTTRDSISGFSGNLRVTSRIFDVGDKESLILLELNDITLLTEADATKLMEYFERAFDFFTITYD